MGGPPRATRMPTNSCCARTEHSIRTAVRLTHTSGTLPLWLRATAAAILLSGMVAGVVPLWIAMSRYSFPIPLGPARWNGVLPLAIGVAVLYFTIRDFFQFGRGTLAPWDAPQALVHQRLYAWVRNPMYLGVLATIAGQAILRASGGLLIYLALIALAFHFRVVLYEGPVLARQFGAVYTAYRQSVPRWLPWRQRGSSSRG
jgi:protein-S-isoprenylcysteine O-methyltransferase Ste14